MSTSTTKCAAELLIEMADAFIPALDQAKDQNHEDGRRLQAIEAGELANLWTELRELAMNGGLDLDDFPASRLDKLANRN